MGFCSSKLLLSVVPGHRTILTGSHKRHSQLCITSRHCYCITHKATTRSVLGQDKQNSYLEKGCHTFCYLAGKHALTLLTPEASTSIRGTDRTFDF